MKQRLVIIGVGEEKLDVHGRVGSKIASIEADAVIKGFEGCGGWVLVLVALR